MKTWQSLLSSNGKRIYHNFSECAFIITLMGSAHIQPTAIGHKYETPVFSRTIGTNKLMDGLRFSLAIVSFGIALVGDSSWG